MAVASTSGSSPIAVITVSFGSESVLPSFLRSISAATTRPTHLVVADNRPAADGRISRLTEAAGGEYLPMPTNLGYGGAVNMAVASALHDTEWLLISNPDVELGEGSIDRLVLAGSKDSTIGAVGPAIYDSAGAHYPSARSLPSLHTGIGHALFANLWASNPWTRAYHNDRSVEVSTDRVGWLSGACVLIRRSAFESVAGFDTDYFMYFEDVDLGYRLGRAGYRNVYEGSASVVHTGAHSTTADSAAMVEAHHASARRFLAKRYPGPAWWPVRTVVNLGLWIRSRVIRERVG